MIIGHLFPNQWWPVTNGAEARHLQIRNLLLALGHEVIALSNTNKKRVWTQQSLTHFRSEMGEILIFNTRTELENIIKNRNIDCLIVDYVDNGAEFDIPSLEIKKILCVHDIGSHNLQYEKHLKWIFDQGDFKDIQDIPLAESEWELDQIERYDQRVTIAQHEHEWLADRNITSVCLPYSPNIRPIKNTYEQFPMTVLGQSMVNLHGLHWFDFVVGAKLFSRLPDTRIDVVGPIVGWMDHELGENYKFHGSIENLDKIFKHARFGFCSAVFGTGQKIKILEMMGASLPVIAYKTKSAESPLDNTCGLLSDDPSEWFDMWKQLWLDRKKCRQMGEIAQQKAATWCPQDKQLEILSSIL